jgi:hypothetical protein
LLLVVYRGVFFFFWFYFFVVYGFKPPRDYIPTLLPSAALASLCEANYNFGSVIGFQLWRAA